MLISLLKQVWTLHFAYISNAVLVPPIWPSHMTFLEILSIIVETRLTSMRIKEIAVLNVQEAIDREGNVDCTKDEEDEVAHAFHLTPVTLRNTKCRSDFLPAKASMEHKDEDAENVESRPLVVLEQESLKGIDITHFHCWDFGILCPEEVKCPSWLSKSEGLHADQNWWWPDKEGPFGGVAKAELEQVNGHEGQKDHSCDAQFH
mmetsp:Transcript_153823/g.268078  ORF Transcript_153823/g.268078 Transcript_153823/m.268078 type:complete len:204 (+) Transcript_153823:14-625(+)